MFSKKEKRRLDKVGAEILSAVALIEGQFGGVLTHDSGHAPNTNPTWIFTFPDRANAQLALRMNRSKLSLYLRARSLDGQDMSTVAGATVFIEKCYTASDKGVLASLLSPAAPFLNPSPSNPLLRIRTNLISLSALLGKYLGIPVITAAGESKPKGESALDEGTNASGKMGSRRATTLEELLAQLDRNADTGARGEQLVLVDELQRLHECGCPVPKDFVELKAVSDVGCGYDIASTWPGQERYIEVKTTRVPGSDIFLTENERRVLSELGEKAWLYRVYLGEEGEGDITARLQNPVRRIAEDAFTPVVWRIPEAAIPVEGTESGGGDA